jgi:predicted RNA-binding Zn ribbon-like protein
MAQDPVPFQLIGGHPVLDFVNTLDNRFAKGGPKELLAHFGDLLRFLAQSGMLSAEQVDRIARSGTRASRLEALQLAWKVRENMASLLYKVVDDREGAPVGGAARGLAPVDLVELNLLIRVSTSLRHLVWVGGPESRKMTWDWERLGPDLPLNKLVASMADLLTSESLNLVRKCGSPTCQWLFLQTGKARGRRWCDMRICGNRVKMKRYRSRGRVAAAKSS